MLKPASKKFWGGLLLGVPELCTSSWDSTLCRGLKQEEGGGGGASQGKVKNAF